MNKDLELNPLLNQDGLPRFSQISPEHIEPALAELLGDNRTQLSLLEGHADDPTWASFIQPLEDLGERLAKMWSPVSHLNSVKDSEALRKVYEVCLPQISEYHTDVGQNAKFFKGFERIKKSHHFSELDVAQKKIIDNALRDFHLMGVDLPAKQKKRFKEIRQRLSKLSNKFERNVLDATQAWCLHITNRDDIAGLPKSILDQAQQRAEKDELEGWKFTLDIPSYVPFMTYADNSELRQQMYHAYVTRASDQGPHAAEWDNAPLMREILRLRHEIARLLGFDNYAQTSLVTKMAESPQQVLDFLRDLTHRAKPVARKELKQLENFAHKKFSIKKLQAWDIPYYSEKLKQELFAFTDEDIRPYFPAPKVLQGMFNVVQRLYGIQIRQIENVEIWDPEVSFFEIKDRDDKVRGQFYVDLYARPNKRGGAWMDECVSRKCSAEGVQTPVAYLTCNFSIPVGDKPALLTHDEVITLFHEFGHGLHHMLTKVDHVSVSGINGVPWDAVELPSQFMENWCWQREALDMISEHYETREPLPDDLLNKMKAAKNFQSALQMVRQLEFSVFDMLLHEEKEPDIQKVLDLVRREVSVIFPPPYNRFQNCFSHIFGGGYAAGYYSYKWAEVLAADAFSLFEERGIYDEKTGRSFMENILEQGGVCDPMELFVAFRGREPSVEPLLRHSGLQS